MKALYRNVEVWVMAVTPSWKTILIGLLMTGLFVGIAIPDNSRVSSVQLADMGVSFGVGFGSGWGGYFPYSYPYSGLHAGLGYSDWHDRHYYPRSGSFVGVGYSPSWQYGRGRPVGYGVQKHAVFTEGRNQWATQDLYRDGGFRQVIPATGASLSGA
jgi:hypothetical protein